jgi:hypothetical protein
MQRFSQVFFSVALILSALNTSKTYAQAAATASIGARIETPVTITKQSDLHFENVSVGSVGSGVRSNGRSTERRQPRGYETRIVAGKVVEAAFNITGNADYAYSISVPPYITVTTNKHTFTIETEAHTASGNQTLSVDGRDEIAIQGVLLSRSNEQLLAMNYEVPNGLPVTINNN